MMSTGPKAKPLDSSARVADGRSAQGDPESGNKGDQHDQHSLAVDSSMGDPEGKSTKGGATRGTKGNTPFVKLSRDKYENMLMMIQKLRQQQLGVHNLNALLYEKDQEVNAFREKAQNYELSLIQTETRLSSVMQMQMHDRTGRPLAHIATTHETTAESTESSLGKISHKIIAESMDGRRGKSPINEAMSADSSMVPARTELEMDCDLTSMAGISKTVFDRVVEENTKIKGTLKDVLEKDGRGSHIFLDAQEYEDIIQQLRSDNLAMHFRCELLQKTLGAVQNDNTVALGTMIMDLNKKLAKTEKTVNTKQSMVNMYSKAYEKLKQDKDKLKHQLHEVSKHDQPGQSETTVPGSTSAVQGAAAKSDQVHELEKTLATVRQQKTALERDVGELAQTLQTRTEERDDFKRKCQEYVKSVAELLGTRRTTGEYPKTMDQLRKENEELNSSIGVLQHDLKRSCEEIELLQTQAGIFKEDFGVELKEKENRERLHGQEISKYQVHIRNLTKQIEHHQQEIIKYKTLLKRLGDEARNLKSLHDAEREKRVLLERLAPQLSMADSCAAAQASALPWNRTQYDPTSIAVDGSMAPMSLTVQSGQSVQAEHTDKNSLECPRCERGFVDQESFKKHVAICSSHAQ